MKSILGYIRQYWLNVNKANLFEITLLTAILVSINFGFNLDGFIGHENSFTFKLFAWFIVFLVAFALPYFLSGYSTAIRQTKKFGLFVLLAPLLFALKISLDIPIHISSDPGWNNYWNHIFYWPALLLIIGGSLFLIWRIFDREQPFYGLTKKDLSWRPYFIMLLLMLPLVALASTQPDFLDVYPKIRSISAVSEEQGMTWMHQVLFELAYGTDFIGIELFFRGFLVLGFIRWAGKDAILPMACFYCAIHFGKPLGECISSYFGGIILGIVVYNTRSILGGLLVHLGIAWLMELGGYIGNSLIR